MYALIAALLLFLLPLPVAAQVEVNLGINFSAPPQMVVVPEVQAVQYVPTANANYFFYGGRYWVFANGGWYYSGGYNGPWVVCAPEYVPQPLLIVPVTYYRRPPPEWRGWTRGVPPRWATNYGHSWSGKREVFVPVYGHSHSQASYAHPPPQKEQSVHESSHPHAVEEARPAEHAQPHEAEHEKAPPEHGGEEGHH